MSASVPIKRLAMRELLFQRGGRQLTPNHSQKRWENGILKELARKGCPWSRLVHSDTSHEGRLRLTKPKYQEVTTCSRRICFLPTWAAPCSKKGNSVIFMAEYYKLKKGDEINFCMTERGLLGGTAAARSRQLVPHATGSFCSTA